MRWKRRSDLRTGETGHAGLPGHREELGLYSKHNDKPFDKLKVKEHEDLVLH